LFVGRPEAAIDTLWPLAVYFGLVVLTAAALLGASWVLGQRHREPATGQPYESGIAVTGSARLRYPVQFYLVAIFFVIFDLETAFLIAWAVAARQAGWAGYVAVVVFVAVLIAALAYLWRVGALDWGPRGGAGDGAGKKSSRLPERQV
jgi:NADH-quinone oxidoreductase subunit A